jgi:carbamoyl-phosphate synthase large subunit
MKSVGEVMGIGATFQESFHKALRSLETGVSGLDRPDDADAWDDEALEAEMRRPGAQRLWYAAEALRRGWSAEKLHETSRIDPWFVAHIQALVCAESGVTEALEDAGKLRRLKQMGFADRRIAMLSGRSESEVRTLRQGFGIRPVFRRVDTCAAEFVAPTAYFYSTYSSACEARPTERQKIVILGGGPNRIGQGIEFDYCCVQGIFAAQQAGYESIMVNCNPETVSTDFDTADRLYFEPLTEEDILEIVHIEQPTGVIVQFGGQTPLRLAVALEAGGVPIIGTSPDAIDRAEDRERSSELADLVGVRQPEAGTASNPDDAVTIAERIGYPVLIRPSYVLGGRAMEVVESSDKLRDYMQRAVKASPDHPVLVDRYLDAAIEIDVDVVCDGVDVLVGGLLEHVEQAGVHSGDSACCLPPHTLSEAVQQRISELAGALARQLGVIGLMNVQFAVKHGEVYLIEVNPRASRTVPFVAKATGLPLARLAARVMAGEKLAELEIPERCTGNVAVKEVVLPFDRFPGVDTLLGPEMRSTGEVMGMAKDFVSAFARATLAAGVSVGGDPGGVLMTVKDSDKEAVIQVAQSLMAAGWTLYATAGTGAALSAAGLSWSLVHRVGTQHPDCAEVIANGAIKLVVNTPSTAADVTDSSVIRKTALYERVAYCTTVAGALATAAAVLEGAKALTPVVPLQEWYASGRNELSSGR